MREGSIDRTGCGVMAAGVLAALAVSGEAWAGAQTSVVDLKPRPGITLRYLALEPAGAPQAAVLLFPGGQGVANIPDRPDAAWAEAGNFLTRSRELFRGHGLFVAVIDAPSDHKGEAGLGAFRIAPDHAGDIAAVIADVRRRSDGAPVWLVGTSRGTISAVNAAARLRPPQGADGLVLTSTLTGRAPSKNPRPGVAETVHDLDIGAIRVPTLLVYHRDDACSRTSPADVPALQRKLAGAPRVGAIAIEGGDPPRSDGCGPLDAHGFLGREAEAVKAIADWILTTKPAQ
ncbi:MAG: alpha/beta hydrolase [Polyangiaceae bacterium]|nr:alpha/beta hydrolase [Polyangiaceae bacterium]